MTDNPAAAGERSFPLIISDGSKRFQFSFKDEGVALNGDGLAWTCGGVAHAKSDRDIDGIRLRVMPTPGQETGQCTITFGGGGELNVMSWNSAGFADAGRAEIYRDFVNALHRKLSPSDRARIAFSSGFPGAGGQGLKILAYGALVAAALLFVLAPLVLALVYGDLKGYALAFGGALLWYGLYWKVRNGRKLSDVNKPRNYSPDTIPAGLMP